MKRTGLVYLFVEMGPSQRIRYWASILALLRGLNASPVWTFLTLRRFHTSRFLARSLIVSQMRARSSASLVLPIVFWNWRDSNTVKSKAGEDAASLDSDSTKPDRSSTSPPTY